ncbi:MAG: hypothetical protein DRG59_12345 [Deltaproteobacteria bacterium]|nr:MAG: hypothetical protein DRG59_12345 [Deltaproteobacteria bacterium]
MLTANSVLIDVLAQLLIEKGLIAEEDFFVKLEEYRLTIDQNRKTVSNSRLLLWLPLKFFIGISDHIGVCPH